MLPSAPGCTPGGSVKTVQMQCIEPLANLDYSASGSKIWNQHPFARTARSLQIHRLQHFVAVVGHVSLCHRAFDGRLNHTNAR